VWEKTRKGGQRKKGIDKKLKAVRRRSEWATLVVTENKKGEEKRKPVKNRKIEPEKNHSKLKNRAGGEKTQT